MQYMTDSWSKICECSRPWNFAGEKKGLSGLRLVEVRCHVLKRCIDALGPRRGRLEVFKPILLREELPFLRAHGIAGRGQASRAATTTGRQKQNTNI